MEENKIKTLKTDIAGLEITDDDIAAKSASNLSDRPSERSSQYGQKGLTPAEIKAQLSELPTHIAGQFNELLVLIVSAINELEKLDIMISGVTSGAGDDSLIANDVAKNKAYADYTMAAGYDTKAGCMLFEIKELSTTDKTYTLSSPLESKYIDEEVTLIFKNNFSKYGKITEISDNGYKVKLDKFTNDEGKTYGENVIGYLKLVNYVDVGDTEFGSSAVSFGYQTKSTGLGSFASGYNTNAEGEFSHTEGRDTYATYAAHAEGKGSSAQEIAAHAEGVRTKAIGRGSHAEGNTTEAGGYASHSEGYLSKNTANYAHAEGYKSEASGEASHAEGGASKASGKYSHAEGELTHASALGAHAEGSASIAEGYGAHAEGGITKAAGNYAHAEGSGAKASGFAAHAEGYETRAIERYAHAEGYKTESAGERAHAEGSGAKASGLAAHAEGVGTIASAQGSHAEGTNTEAKHTSSHVSGLGTVSGRDNQSVVGMYNAEDAEALFVVGNGDNKNKPSNAFSVNEDGTATLGAEPKLEMDAANKGYVDNKKIYNHSVTLDYLSEDYTVRHHIKFEKISTSNIPITINDITAHYCAQGIGFDGDKLYHYISFYRDGNRLRVMSATTDGADGVCDVQTDNFDPSIFTISDVITEV